MAEIHAIAPLLAESGDPVPTHCLTIPDPS
jgi:hypothetical protein